MDGESIEVGTASQIAEGDVRVVTARERRIAVFRLGDRFFAIDARCPHQGADLTEGQRDGAVVTCPWHQWQFDVESGQRVGRPDQRVDVFDVAVDGDRVRVSANPTTNAVELSHYLVRYGVMARIEHFASVAPLTGDHRGSCLVRTARGIEMGTLLSDAMNHPPSGSASPTGEVLRLANDEDLTQSQAHSAEATRLLNELLQSEETSTELSSVVDCEVLFDGQTVVLYFLGEADSQLAELGQQLETRWSRRVHFQHLTDDDPPSSGESCGGGGCGSGGCGLGSNSEADASELARWGLAPRQDGEQRL